MGIPPTVAASLSLVLDIPLTFLSYALWTFHSLSSVPDILPTLLSSGHSTHSPQFWTFHSLSSVLNIPPTVLSSGHSTHCCSLPQACCMCVLQPPSSVLYVCVAASLKCVVCVCVHTCMHLSHWLCTTRTSLIGHAVGCVCLLNSPSMAHITTGKGATTVSTLWVCWLNSLSMAHITAGKGATTVSTLCVCLLNSPSMAHITTGKGATTVSTLWVFAKLPVHGTHHHR